MKSEQEAFEYLESEACVDRPNPLNDVGSLVSIALGSGEENGKITFSDGEGTYIIKDKKYIFIVNDITFTTLRENGEQVKRALES